MKWTDNDIDKLFKDKAENVSFAYKNDYWKEMEAMIPAKKKGGDAFWLLTSFLLIGLLALTPFLEENKQLKKGNSTTQLLAEQVQATHNNSVVSTKKMIANKNNKKINPLENEESKGQLNDRLPNNTSDYSSSSNRGAVNSLNNAVANKNNAATQNIEGSNAFETNKMGNDAKNKIDNTGDNSVENNNRPSSVNQSNVANENTNSNERENPMSKNTDAIAENNLKVSSVTHQVGSLPFNNLQTMENSMNSELAAFNGIGQDLKMPSRVAFYGQALGGLSQSMVIPSNQYSYNMGLGFGVQINKGKLEISAGLNGIWSIHDDIILSRQAKVYSFGSDVVNYELKYKEIFSLEANLSLGYKLGNSTLSIGLRPSYNAGSKIAYRTSDLNGTETIENFYGFSEGINRFGLKPMLGYSYNFRKGLSIGLNIGMQLFPLVDESFVQGMNSKLPIDGQIYLRKQINFRKQ
ncbi:MAG TPA: hypothetical protein EYG86_06620 [Crocinitomicaceae bacterium]|nr:hypothetical protein [Crocinitomicaceae bacterium]